MNCTHTGEEFIPVQWTTDNASIRRDKASFGLGTKAMTLGSKAITCSTSTPHTHSPIKLHAGVLRGAAKVLSGLADGIATRFLHLEIGVSPESLHKKPLFFDFLSFFLQDKLFHHQTDKLPLTKLIDPTQAGAQYHLNFYSLKTKIYRDRF